MHITLNRNQIKYEVDVETHKSALILQQNPDLQYESNLAEDYDKAYFEQKCQEGVDQLLDIMERYEVSCNGVNQSSTSASDEAESNRTWEIILSFPGGRSYPIASSLTQACHRFVASYFLEAWATMAFPSLAAEYINRMTAAGMDVRKIIHHKKLPTTT